MIMTVIGSQARDLLFSRLDPSNPYSFPIPYSLIPGPWPRLQSLPPSRCSQPGSTWACCRSQSQPGTLPQPPTLIFCIQSTTANLLAIATSKPVTQIHKVGAHTQTEVNRALTALFLPSPFALFQRY